MPALRIPRPTLALERFTLDNGLRVVLQPDRSAPAVAIAVYYDVGFRSEPEGRTGFAHLFEHLMFEGSVSLEKSAHFKLVQSNGGILNGSTRYDFTNYYEQLPSNALELGLFLEADRMRGIRLSEETLRNQLDVVKEEIRVNVLNRPYGGFPWILLPPVMYRTFNNSHNGYGSFEDLEAATVDDAADFFDRYYAPGNAVLAVAGDLDVDATRTLIERHFADIPARPVPPVLDCGEPRPDGERRGTHLDPLAPAPALAAGYRVPDPIADVDDYCAIVLAGELLYEGETSRLYRRLVREDRLATHVFGTVNIFGDPFEVRDPTMLQVLAYHASADVDPLLRAVDEEVERLGAGVPGDELDRVVTSAASDHFRRIDNLLPRAQAIAVLEQQRGAPELVNELPARLASIRPADIERVVADWLRPEHRAVLDLQPAGGR